MSSPAPCAKCAHTDIPAHVKPCVDCLLPNGVFANFREPVVPLTVQVDALNARSAPDILDAAAGHMRDRAATYDQPGGERSMGRAVAALNAVLGRQALTESEGWLLLQLLKDVRDRQRTEPHRDSLEDAVAYAALKAEARLDGR